MDLIIEQLSEVQRPFMGYYHLLPPHDPYNPRVELLESLKRSMAAANQAGQFLFARCFRGEFG